MTPTSTQIPFGKEPSLNAKPAPQKQRGNPYYLLNVLSAIGGGGLLYISVQSILAHFFEGDKNALCFVLSSFDLFFSVLIIFACLAENAKFTKILLQELNFMKTFIGRTLFFLYLGLLKLASAFNAAEFDWPQFWIGLYLMGLAFLTSLNFTVQQPEER